MNKLFCLAILCLLFTTFGSLRSEESKGYMIEVSGGISPATADYISVSLKDAEEEGFDLFIIQLNTPGGLLESTRDITSTILQSRIPVVVYVGPSGARAGSAGAFISMAADLLAMSPGSNIGSAHPVGLDGESGDSTDVMTQKMTNDAAALMRSLARKTGRDIDVAESMVRNSSSMSEDEALEAGICDLIAKNRSDLENLLSGVSIKNSKLQVQLHKKVTIEEIEASWIDTLLLWLADPNIAYIFILLAGYGIVIELYNPGSIFPGAIGVVSALLAAYSLNILPVNWVGFGLLAVSGLLIILEVFVTSYGLLSIGAVITLFLGSTMLFDSPNGAFDISMDIIISIIILISISAALIIYFAINSQSTPKAVGKDSLVGKQGNALTYFSANGNGKIFIRGENWKAINQSDTEIQKGQKIRVIKTELLTAYIE